MTFSLCILILFLFGRKFHLHHKAISMENSIAVTMISDANLTLKLVFFCMSLDFKSILQSIM